MEDFMINVSRVEELQTLNDMDELDRIFAKAKSAIVNGAGVILYREQAGQQQPFDAFSTLEELEEYKSTVLKYLT